METRKFRLISPFLLAQVGVLLILLTTCEIPEYPEPILNSIKPTSGSPGTKVFINGKFLNNVSGIWFGPTLLTNYEFYSDSAQSTTIIVEVPPQDPGDIQVSFEMNGKNTKGINFEVLPVRPNIDIIEPEKAAIGDKITLVGINFSEELKIHFEGVENSEIEFRDNKVITAVVPEGATSGLVYLVGNNDINSNSLYFSVLGTVSGAPSISKIEPSSGKIGDVITIEGTNFQSSPIIVTLADVLLILNTDYTVESDNKLSIKLPSNSKSGPLIIKNAEGEDGREFEITGPPIIDRILPARNSWGGPIIIFGKNLQFVEKLEFGSTILLKPNFTYFKDYDGADIIYGRVPNATLGNTGLILTGSLSGNSAKFEYFVQEGEELPLPLGFNNVVFPNFPQSPSLFNMNNSWAVNILDNKLLGIVITDYLINDEYYGISSGGNSIGFYKKDGSFIYIKIEDKPYEGRRDPNFSDNGVSRIVLTPLEEGAQVEMIFPLFIEKINPAVIAKGEILTITGRYFNRNDFSGSEGFVTFGGTNYFETPEDSDASGYNWVSRTVLEFKIPENTVPGNYILSVGNNSLSSNEITVKVTD